MYKLLFVLLTLFARGNAFEPTKLEYFELEAQIPSAGTKLVQGLQDVGLVSIKAIPEFSTLRKHILATSASCLVAESHDSLLMDLPDGTKRYTMGAASNEALSGVNFNNPECQEFSQAQANFRSKVDQITQMIVSLLDKSLGLSGKQVRLLMDTEDLSVSHTVSEIVQDGFHLEHFHLYEKDTTLKDLYIHDFSRKLHTDHGLFIVLTPALTLNSVATSDHGFFIQLKNGEIVQPDFGPDQSELVFMIGDGFKQWLSPKIGIELRSTPHAVVMPYTSQHKSMRSWYGRMIMPKSSLYLEPQKKTFGELRKLMMSEDKSDKQAVKHMACSAGLVLGDRFLQNCGEGEISCWNNCVPISCDTNSEPRCGVQVDDGFQDCDVDEHGTQCRAQCVANSVQSVDLGTNFCNGLSASMYMDGFQGIASRDQECLVFLFNGFKLDSAGKYFVASALSVLIGLITEIIVYQRRQVAAWKQGTRGKTFVKLSLYSLQVTFGYLAMLIAMTYSLLLFAMVVSGLTVGHRLFNFKIVPKENQDPCCPAPMEEKHTPETL